MIVTTSHAALRDGYIQEAPANTIVESLKIMKTPFIFIRHSINGTLKSKAHIYESNRCEERILLPFPIKISILRYLLEILSTINFFIFGVGRREEVDVFIGVDPLNAITGLILKKLKIANKVIFYSVDFSDTRFKNKFINFIYFKIDDYCMKNADEVWSVSSRIVNLRKSKGLENSRNIFVPNVPSDEYKKYVKNCKDKLCMITLGKIDTQLEYSKVFTTIRKMKKKYPNIKFKIVGSGPLEALCKNQCRDLGIEKNVIFMGNLKHGRALEEISKSGIGVALYSGIESWSFNYYGDSMKCREYFCFGLPVLTTDTHSTVDDIRNHKAGLIVENEEKDYVSELEDIIENYDKFSKNSYNLARIYNGVHLDNLKRVCT